MKTPSTDLFDLIKTLSKGEKLYFKKHSKESSTLNKAYITLFDAIDKIKVYDEKKLLIQLGYSKNPKAFAVLKNYLYTELINTVTKITDTEEHKPDAMHQLQQLNFLANKGLFSQYHKIWNRSYIDAQEKELFQVQFLLRNQLHNLKINFYLKTTHQELKEIIEQDAAFNNQYEAVQKIRNLFRTIQLYNQQSHIRLQDQEITDLKKFLQHPLLQQIIAQPSFHYYYYYHFCLALIHYLTHDYAKAFHHLEKIKKEILNNQNLVIANNHLNIDFISTYYLVAFLLKEYTAFFQYLNMPFIQKIEARQHQAYIFAYWANSHIRYYISSGLYKEAKEHIQKTEKQIEAYLNDIPIEIKQLLLCSLSIANLIINNYNEAYYRVKNCLATFQLYPKQDIQRTIYCLGIIISYELKNKRLLNHECDVAYQFFYRKKMSSKFEVILISFFRKLAKANYGRMELRAKFSILKKQLEPIKKDPILGQVFRYFNFFGWVESKEQGISYMEYVQAQTKQ
jgi:hypothetical protein